MQKQHVVEPSQTKSPHSRIRKPNFEVNSISTLRNSNRLVFVRPLLTSVDTIAETLLTMQQVEDTLNNSNDLFLTFRKEMEEMSKKTKRLEKENLTLTRRHDQTTQNVLRLAEERMRDKEEIERMRKQDQRMRNIIKSMQEQRRGEPLPQEVVDEEGTESEYDEEYDDDEDDDEDDEGSYEGEEELAAEPTKPVFGPEPPPEMVANKANGQTAPAVVNGVKH